MRADNTTHYDLLYQYHHNMLNVDSVINPSNPVDILKKLQRKYLQKYTVILRFYDGNGTC